MSPPMSPATSRCCFWFLSFPFLRACSLDLQAAHTHSGSTAGFGVCEYVVCGYVFAAGSDVEIRLGI